MPTITIGTKVQLKPGSEPWAFSGKTNKVFAVAGIRTVTNRAGLIHATYLSLAGRQHEVVICDVIPFDPSA
jgi:hypothetical protein